MIPRIIHQTWKDDKPPKKWHAFVSKVRELNPGWEYRLWTDADNDAFVEKEMPEFIDVFRGFSRGIMRADVIRYVIMHRIGGVYLDLDYEMLQPFDFGDERLVLPKNRSIAYGDKEDTLGNCIFASVPGHRFWKDVLDDLQANPPVLSDYTEVIEATGPMLLTRIYRENRDAYQDIHLPERILYHPPSPRNARQARKIRKAGESLGIHHPWGSWKERWTVAYLKSKTRELLP